MKRVKYYFGFASPFAALADARIDELVCGAGAELEPIPLTAPPAEPLDGIAATLHEYKYSYQMEDAARWAARLGLQWNPPYEPVDASDASIGYYAALDHGDERSYRRAVFGARYADGLDIADRGVLADCAATAGLSADRFRKALDDETYRERLWAKAGDAFAERVFGVPLFVVGDQRFWGNDRLDFLLEALRR